MTIRSSPDVNLTTPSRSSRRTIVGLALNGLAGLAGLGSVAAKPKRKLSGAGRPNAGARRRPKRNQRRRPRFKVVTRTFTSTVPITIPDYGAANPYPSAIQVGGLRAGRITDVNVTLTGLSHEHPADIDAILVAPNELTSVVLMNRVGEDEAITDVTLTLDDQAAAYLPFVGKIVSGTFKPTQPGAAPRPETSSLREFNGLNPNGTWRLYVADGADGDIGSIDGWSLTIKARVRV